jgi:hypothetical protein
VSDLVYGIGVGACFAPALVAALACLREMWTADLSDATRNRASTWLVYGLVAAVIWTVIALLI